MNVELSKFEIELIDQALNSWEREPQTDGAMGGIISAMLCRGSKEESMAAMKESRTESERVTTKRRLQGALLRAKLLQALAIASEHAIDPEQPNPTKIAS